MIGSMCGLRHDSSNKTPSRDWAAAPFVASGITSLKYVYNKCILGHCKLTIDKHSHSISKHCASIPGWLLAAAAGSALRLMIGYSCA